MQEQIKIPNSTEISPKFGFIIAKTFFLAIFVLCVMPIQALLVYLPFVKKTPFPSLFARFIHRCVLRVMNVQVKTIGSPTKQHPTLFVSNHTSYIDIPVLGALLRGSFVAKSDIASWPFLGQLAKLQQTIFLDRKAINVLKHSQDIAERLLGEDSLIIFPEGTTNNGTHVDPFKSSLFDVAKIKIGQKEIIVQPISLTYAALDGMPMGRHFRKFFAWIGDDDLVSNARNIFGIGKITVIITFHDPVKYSDFGSRKALAEYCTNVVRQGHADVLSCYPFRKKKNRIRDWISSKKGTISEKISSFAKT